jgi:hypothetical protein
MFFRLFLMVILATAQAFAQRGGGGRSSGDMAGMPMASASRLDIISQTLQLSKEQKKYIKTTLDDAQKESAPVRMELIKSHQAIGEAIQAGKSPEEINGLISSHTVFQSQMAQIELKAFAKIFLRLDKTQQGNTRSLFQMMKGMFSEKNWNVVQ